MSTPVLDADYWNSRYKTNETGWDAGTVTTPIKEFIDHWQNKDSTILIPGCGNGHEAAYLLESGYSNITLIDIAESAAARLKERFSSELGKRINIVTGDFFKLEGQFDLIIEQTFFCALHPSLRRAYAEKMKALLSPVGVLAGVLFNREFPGGPPFGGSIDEYQKLFHPLFEIRKLEPCYNSIAPRAGAEVFVILGSKPAGE